jgi:uncharacterized coiled-coil protein SlyX
VASRGFITGQRALALLLLGSLVSAFLPVRLLGFTRGLSGVAVRLTAPADAAFKLVGDWIAESERAEHPNPSVGRLEELESLLRQKDMIIEDLAQRIADLEQTDSVPAEHVRRLVGRVFAAQTGPSGGFLRVRRGARDGVILGSVATVRGRHMLGLVSAVESDFCVVTPLADRSAGPIEVLVYAGAGTDLGVRFDLSPVGDGTLRGAGRFVTEGEGQQPVLIEPGATAYLSDPALAPHWGLEVGEVLSVDRDEQSPLRPVITVRPRIDGSRAASVILRVPTAEPGTEQSP